MATLQTKSIMHVAVKSKYRRSVVDVRTMRGDDISSDRVLVVAKIKIKLERRKSNSRRHLWSKCESIKLMCPDIKKQYVEYMRKKLDKKPPSDDVEKS